MKSPVGHHSPGLQRILHVFRGEPLKDKYVLVTIKPHKEWQLARLSGERGKPLTRLDTFYTCLKEAERDVFVGAGETSPGKISGSPQIREPERC